MKWVKEEVILAIGYYKKYGNKTSGNNFEEHVEIFSKLQNRSWGNSFNTFSLKIANIHSVNLHETFKGSLASETNIFYELWKNIDVTIKLYDELIVNSKYCSNPKKEDFFISVPDEQEAVVEYNMKTLREYLLSVKQGYFKVPLFQRDFVWSQKEIIAFLNSLFRGHPFGNITVWNASNTALDNRNKIIIDYAKGSKNDKNVKWLIDGQQRTTTVVSVITQHSSARKIKDIVFSLSHNEFLRREKDTVNFISASDLLDESISIKMIKEKYNTSLDIAARILELRNRILSQNVGITDIDKADINTAIEIFTEMNTKGKKLSLYDILHAKWMSSEIDFDLEEMFNNWKPKVYKPDNLTLIKSLYLLFPKNTWDSHPVIKSNDLLSYKLSPALVSNENVEKYLRSFSLASDFLMNDMGFKESLVPSTNIFKFLVYAFYKSGNPDSFNSKTNKAIKKYIKLVSLNNYYSSSTEQKLAKNLDHIDAILKNPETDFSKFNFKIILLTEKDILSIEYGEGSSSYYFILNTLFKYAKSFKSSQTIPPVSTIEKNSTIQIHHIIPKSIKFDDERVEDIQYGNSLANLTPILEVENKEIQRKYPADYYREYAKENEELDQILLDVKIDPDYIREIKKDTPTLVLKNFWEDRATKLAELVNKY